MKHEKSKVEADVVEQLVDRMEYVKSDRAFGGDGDGDGGGDSASLGGFDVTSEQA